MKRILLLLIVLVGISACTKYEDLPVTPISFEIDGKKYYSPKDTSPIIYDSSAEYMRICQTEDDRLTISYYRDTDFINHDIEEIILKYGIRSGTFETGTIMSFNSSDNTWMYPEICFTPIKTGDAYDQDRYVGESGSIIFDIINWVNMTVTGRFEFKARLEGQDVCKHPKTIQVYNGSFKNIPFSFTNYSQNQQ